MDDFERHLAEILPEKDSLRLVKAEAARYAGAHTHAQCLQTGFLLYGSENFQIQEAGVLLLSYAAHAEPEALAFLRETVSAHENWKVQEVLAMAFDNHCRIAGYEQSLPLIHDWLSDGRANVRRAVSEGLRIWTSRPYFREHPKEAIAILAAHREDKSAYVRRSVGNALKDIGRKYPHLLCEELRDWDLSSQAAKQVYGLACKHLPDHCGLEAGRVPSR